MLQLEDAAGGEEDAWLADVLVRRLADDDPGVAAAALESPLLLSRVPAPAAFEALRSVLARSTAAAQAAEVPADKAGPRGAARRVRTLGEPPGWLRSCCGQLCMC